MIILEVEQGRLGSRLGRIDLDLLDFRFGFVLFGHDVGRAARFEVREDVIERVGVVRRRAWRRGKRVVARTEITRRRTRLDRFGIVSVEVVERMKLAVMQMSNVLQHVVIREPFSCVCVNQLRRDARVRRRERGDEDDGGEREASAMH